MDMFDQIDFENEKVNVKVNDGEKINEDFSIVIPVMGHYMDALFASEETLTKCPKVFSEAAVKTFNPPKLTAGQHRALYGLFKIYSRRGLSLKTFTEGIFVTPYELCEAMEYKRNKLGKFHIADQKEAIENVMSIGRKMMDIYKKEFQEVNKKNDKKVYKVCVHKDVKLLDCVYQAFVEDEEDTEEEEKVRKHVRKLWVKLHESLFNEHYFKLSLSNFYSEISQVLRKNNRRITEYHWTFMLWLLKQNKQTTEINVDKLVKILKIYTDNKNLSRARKYVRDLYVEFKEINYLIDYEFDVQAKSGGKKDVLVINPETFESLKKNLQRSKEKGHGYSRN